MYKWRKSAKRILSEKYIDIRLVQREMGIGINSAFRIIHALSDLGLIKKVKKSDEDKITKSRKQKSEQQ